MDEIIISILVPMYNAEATIKRCLEKLMNQCGSIAEIVVLDDGSTDGCLVMAKEIEKITSKVRVYSQTNKGVAYTRQRLLELAKGKYIMFCDADDYFEDNVVEIVYKDITECSKTNESPDVFVYGYNLVRSFGNKMVERRKLQGGIYSKKEFSKEHAGALNDLYWSALWNKCYKKKLCFEPRIEFEILMEDVLFNLDYFSRCKYIFISTQVIYNYVQIGESLTRTKRKDDEDSLRKADETYQKLCQKALKAYPDERKKIIEHIYMLYCSLMSRAKSINDLALYEKTKEYCAEFRTDLGLSFFSVEVKRLLMFIKNIIKSSIR